MTAQEPHRRGMRASVAVKRRLAEQLVKGHRRPIAIIARKQLPHIGEFAALELPRQRRQLSTLAAAVYGMARAATANEATFLEAGLSGDFVGQLVAATDALEDGITDKGRAEGARVKATEGVRKEARGARFALSLIDALVRATVPPDDILLDEWGKVSRVAALAISSAPLADPLIPAPGPGEPGSGTPPTTPSKTEGGAGGHAPPTWPSAHSFLH